MPATQPLRSNRPSAPARIAAAAHAGADARREAFATVAASSDERAGRLDVDGSAFCALYRPPAFLPKANVVLAGRTRTQLADIAGVVAFLASDDARFVNGVNLPVDGGLTASNGQPRM